MYYRDRYFWISVHLDNWKYLSCAKCFAAALNINASGHVTFQPNVASDFDYDSDNESDTDDEDDDIFGNDVNESEIEDDGLDDSILKKQQERAEKKKIFQEKLNEHYNSNSYPWLIMKLSLVKIASANISSFLSMAGLEISGKLLFLKTDWPVMVHAFCISKARLKLVKKKSSKTKQHSEPELLLFENHSLSFHVIVQK